jgi:serine-type D-Ala-D-Ala carboxypeptidase (penicillin-binding protein 5/6)
MKKHLTAFFLLLLLSAAPALAMETEAKQAIVIDDGTGSVLFAKNADEKMHPSSMSKLMTVYIAFSRLKEGSLKLTDTLPVSEKAWRTQGSKTFVELGARIPVEALLEGIIIQSGNDACVVVAEGLAGSEEAFAGQMNDTARKLGLTNSHFSNSNGLPDPNHLMSARDLATLAHHIIHDFPEYYHYFSQKEFVYHGIKQGNRNLLLYRSEDEEVDGLKTGHTDEGGFGMVSSARDKSGRRIITVVNGLPDEKARAEESEQLLAFGFRDFDNVTLLRKGQVLEKAEVWFGNSPEVGLTADKDVVLTLPKAGRDKMKFTLSYNGPLPAPVHAGDHVADLRIDSPGGIAQTVPLVAASDVDSVHGFSRLFRVLQYYASGSKAEGKHG